MVMHPVKPVVKGLAGSLAREDVDVMSPSFKGGGEFGHVDPHSAHRDRMQRFPRKQRDFHARSSSAIDSRIGR